MRAMFLSEVVEELLTFVSFKKTTRLEDAP